MSLSRPEIEALFRSAHIIETDKGCFEWLGARTSDGYGSTAKGYPHRLAYAAAYGPVPAGLEIDHLCRNRACCNPAHLEAVTHAENMRRSAAARTHCPAGHAYDAENTLRYKNARLCRTCRNARRRKAVAA